LGTALDENGEGVRDFVGPCYLVALGSHPQRLGGGLDLFPLGNGGWSL
jgi:hypothetical protein